MKKKMLAIFVSAFLLGSLVCQNKLNTKADTSTTTASKPGINWMNNTNYFPLGANYAWQDWDYDFSDNGWDSRFTTIKSTFDQMSSQGVHAVRWWVYCNMWASPLFSSTDGKGLCTGLPTNWVTHMKQAADYANSKNMKIYFTFTSFDVAKTNNSWYHGSIIDDPTVRKSFIDNAVVPVVQALGTNPGVMGWDVVNEPEWMIASADGGSPGESIVGFPLSTVRSFVKDMVDTIHKYAKQPVSVGSASMKWIGAQYNFWSGLGLDFYDFHWYDWATPWFNPLTTPVSSLKLDKPVIIGEMMPDTMNSSLKMSHQQVLEGLVKNGYSGYLLWAWTDSNTNCVGKTTPDFDNFKKAHPELNIDKPGSNSLKGDLNGDGKVDASDVSLLKQYILNPSQNYDTTVLDMNNDGKVNVQDYILLEKSIANS
ncbi:cellulase family glycosylhydrolase [Clostridium sp. 19966]|uniref:dockerin type I repeat-containing protein n=1 Tax=Clostridium sp. 19966 TaxID=2768166 RepID=UPI0028DD6A96|nr:dockerin type I repeat-containing protein [Clostridium sp. 19966]MDT8718326.1 cellulase family glycosylhydrolase [Clostridium sp. 19966]